MIPSERINQIFSSRRQQKGFSRSEDRQLAIIQFLDEVFSNSGNIQISGDTYEELKKELSENRKYID